MVEWIGFDADDTLWHNETLFHFLMVGNSIRSDILPVLATGGRAVRVYYPLCWEHELLSDEELDGQIFETIQSLDELVPLVDRLCGA